MIENINITNKEILSVLDNAVNMDLSGDKGSKIKGFTDGEYHVAVEYAVSKTYLEKRLQNIDPKIEFAFNLVIGETEGGTYILNQLKSILQFDGFYTSGYKPCGFVGWHSDTDIHGYYLMLTYSVEGNGFFRYLQDKNVVTLHDNKGWMIRAMKLGDNEENAVWHCAVAYCPRFTFLLRFDSFEKYTKALNILQVNYD